MADTNTKSRTNDGRGEVKNPETDGRLKENQSGSSRSSENESGSSNRGGGSDDDRGSGSR